MPTVPTRPDPGTRPLIEAAVLALRCFGADLNRAIAAELLPMWRRRNELTPADYAAVLDAFGPAPEVPAHDGYVISGRDLLDRISAASLAVIDPPAGDVRPAGTVPHGADRWAEPGEVCTCGLPAKVVYLTEGYGDVGFCGRHG